MRGAARRTTLKLQSSIRTAQRLNEKEEQEQEEVKLSSKQRASLC